MPLLENRVKEPELRDFAVSLVLGVLRNRDELDQLIASKADNWSVSRMAATDRNILRMGAYELRYTDTPPRVAIDEAVELAKRFGAANSSQFVNGILDKLIEKKE
jgi:transcription antitermination protein NusB